MRCAHGQGAALWAGAGGMSTAEGTRSSFGGKGAAVPPGGGGTMGTAGHRAPRGASPAPLKPPAHGDVAPGPAVPLPGPVPGWRRGAPSPLCPPAGYRHGGHRGCTGPWGQGLFGENPPYLPGGYHQSRKLSSPLSGRARPCLPWPLSEAQELTWSSVLAIRGRAALVGCRQRSSEHQKPLREHGAGGRVGDSLPTGRQRVHKGWGCGGVHG